MSAHSPLDAPSGAALPSRPAGFAALDAAFAATIARWRGGVDPIVILFSGGVDSGLLAWELRDRENVRLFTVGVAGAADLEAARAAAGPIGRPWEGRTLPPTLIDEVRGRADAELRTVSPGRRAIFVALAAAFATAPEGTLLCGQGADELFLGYAHFRGLDPASAGRRAADDLAQLLSDDWPRTVRLAAVWGRTVVAPYLDDGFVRAVESIPVTERAPTDVAKPYWRAWAHHRGVPLPIADRPKRALQYGSGVAAQLRGRAR